MPVHIELPLDPNTGVAITTAIITSSILHSLSTGTMTSVRPEQSDASTPPCPISAAEARQMGLCVGMGRGGVLASRWTSRKMAVRM